MAMPQDAKMHKTQHSTARKKKDVVCAAAIPHLSTINKKKEKKKGDKKGKTK